MAVENQMTSFDKIKVSPEWCFKNARSTEQWTHGYHRYPAKFLPNLVKKLIEDYTQPTDLVADFFAGCGTTLVEAKVHGRRSVGVDINPVAELITSAKIKPIEPERLERKFKSIIARFEDYDRDNFIDIDVHEKVDYWFFPRHKYKIAFLYEVIFATRDENTRTFFLVALSHILKNCSKWLQSSTKPQVDPDKKPTDPFVAFTRHTKLMIKKNKEFFDQLQKNMFLNTECEIRLEDARQTSLEAGSVGAIITSPPYVTSYEYAEIHQLTGYWFDYFKDLTGFRKKFIGTFYSLNQDTTTNSELANKIIRKLLNKDKRTAKEVANYFRDMYSVAIEMHRVLQQDGHACLVLGNTTFRGVRIKSAEVLTDMLSIVGFDIVEVIKRSIPNKLIPTIRDKKSGRFSKLKNKDSKLIYPEEYIIVAKKL